MSRGLVNECNQRCSGPGTAHAMEARLKPESQEFLEKVMTCVSRVLQPSRH